MSDIRSGSYCEVVSQEVPAHRCLCWEAPRHVGEHRCLCGHVWGDPWHEMTYDQQRAWLGLPDVSPQVPWDRIRLSLNQAAKGLMKFGESMNRTLEALNYALANPDIDDEERP